MAGVLAVRRDVRVIGLVSTAHGLSHIYYMALPPLFPILKDQLGVSYTELGLLMTVFNVTAGVGQTPVGFMVDRVGSRAVLAFGLILQAAAIGAIGLAPGYDWVLGCVFLAGLAHTVYHPADYSIMSSTVPKARLGRAFSIHSFCGNVGSAISPALMVAATAFWGWRAAFLLVGAVGLVMAFTLIGQGAVLGNSHEVKAKKRDGAGARGSLALLASTPILFAFLFYVIVVAGTNGIRTFAVSALVDIQSMQLATANAALTGFMLATAGGMLIGGWVADRLGPRIITAVVSLMSCAALYMLIAAVSMPVLGVVLALALAGMLRGGLQATRDLLVYSVTPEGQHGKVFAFVSSGANIGGAAVPVAFGWAMDIGDPRLVFWISAATTVIALFTFAGMKRAATR
jgi:MFS transporter, FSR family, fosmidomycin resistance protein